MRILEAIRLRAVVWVWKHTPDCAEMSRLASRSLDQPLSWRLRLRMRLHFLICLWCQRYFKQLKFLRQAAPSLAAQAGTLPGRGLSPEARQRLVQRLQIAEDKKA